MVMLNPVVTLYCFELAYFTVATTGLSPFLVAQPVVFLSTMSSSWRS